MTEYIGFYNKYIFNNNSYLKSHIVRDVVKKHNNKDLSMKIEETLDIQYYNCPLRNKFYKCKSRPIFLKNINRKVHFFVDKNNKTNKNFYSDNLKTHDYFTKVNIEYDCDLNNKLPLIKSKCDVPISTESPELTNKLPLIKSKCDVSINTESPGLNDKSTNTKTTLDFLNRNKVQHQKCNFKQDYNLNTNNASICKRINIYNKNII